MCPEEEQREETKVNRGTACSHKTCGSHRGAKCVRESLVRFVVPVPAPKQWKQGATHLERELESVKCVEQQVSDPKHLVWGVLRLWSPTGGEWFRTAAEAEEESKKKRCLSTTGAVATRPVAPCWYVPCLWAPPSLQRHRHCALPESG